MQINDTNGAIFRCVVKHLTPKKMHQKFFLNISTKHDICKNNPNQIVHKYFRNKMFFIRHNMLPQRHEVPNIFGPLAPIILGRVGGVFSILLDRPSTHKL